MTARETVSGAPALDSPKAHSAIELISRYRRGDLTVPEAVEQALATAETATSMFGAFAYIDADGARRAARALDTQPPSGLLHGVPVAVKDVIDVAGLPVVGGSQHLVGRRAQRDAACVASLRAAGAVIIGITVTHELAYGPTGDRSVHGPVRNPNDPSRMTGGSSAGSAVAVATGAVPLSLGTDTGGSIRIPAGLSGVLGLKPTYDAVSRDGLLDLAPSLDHVGIHARSVEDVRLAMDVLTNHGGRRARPRPFRAAWLTFPEGTPVDPDVSELVHAHASRAFGPLPRVHLDPATADQIRDDFYTIQGAEALAQHAGRVESRPQLFDPELLERLRASESLPAWKYVQALDRRHELRRAACALFAETDLLVTPTTPITAPMLDQRRITVAGCQAAVRDLLLSMTRSWNLLGFPAISVPLPTHDEPVGAQLVAPPGQEDRLLDAAEVLMTSGNIELEIA